MVSRRTVIIAITFTSLLVAYLLLSKEKPLIVTTHTVERGDVTATVANTRAGSVMACRRARLAPTIGGQIALRAVNEGDSVSTGQLLLELWNDDLKAHLALTQREADASASHEAQSCLMSERAAREAERQQTLYKKKLISEEVADQAATNALALDANCKAATAGHEVSKRRIDVAQANLERTRIRAPFDGTIAEINGELAEFVTPSPIGVSTPPAVDLVDISCLYISAPIDEVDAPRIKTLMDAHISLDAFPGERFDGIVQRIAPYVLAVEKQARTVEVETVFSNPDEFARMLPGYSADVEIILDSQRDVLRIPSEAILRDGVANNEQAEQAVLVIHDDGLLERRTITSGISNWQFTEITSGLKADEQIVLSVDRDGVVEGAYVSSEKAK